MVAYGIGAGVGRIPESPLVDENVSRMMVADRYSELVRVQNLTDSGSVVAVYEHMGKDSFSARISLISPGNKERIVDHVFNNIPLEDCFDKINERILSENTSLKW